MLPLNDLNFDGWTTEQKLDLIEKIWDTIPDTEPLFPVPDWHREIIERCVAEDDANPDSGTPWDEVKAELKAEL